MGIDVSLALEEGAGRLATVPGATVAGLFVLAGLVELPVQQTLSRHLWEWLVTIPEVRQALSEQYGEGMVPANPLALDLGVEAALAILAVLFVLVVAFRVFGIRVFAAGEMGDSPGGTTWSGVLGAFGHVLLFEVALLAVVALLLAGPALLGSVGGSGVALLVILLYFVVLGILLVLPVLLYFARQAIVLDGENAFAAIGESYRLAREDFAPLVVLLAVVFVAGAVGGLGLGTVLPGGDVGPILTTVYQRVVAVFGIAVSTQAYLQTR